MDNRSFEDRLRTELQEAVTDVEPAPLPRTAARRTRVRQMVAVAAVIAVVAAVTGTTMTVLSGSDDPSRDVASTREGVDDPRGTGGTYPCSHPEIEGQCIAHGEFDGTEWWIGAHMKGDDLCKSDAQEGPDGLGGSGMGCGPYDPEKIGFGVTSYSDHLEKIASGEVAASVDRLLLERSDGPALELELYPAPDGFPLDVRFYNVFLPEDALELVAYDAQGNVVARQTAEVAGFNFPRPQVVSPRTRIASGEIEGHPWTFEAREELTNGDVTPCSDVMFGYQEEFGGGGSCYHRVPDKHPIGFSQSSFERGPAYIVVFGVVDARATEVVVELDRGDAFTTEVHEAPEGFRDDIVYYVVWIPRVDRPNPPGRIVAFDAGGFEVGREELCGEIASRGGTCGN